MRSFYCYDDIERFSSIYEMMESLEQIDQLSEGVVYYTTEARTVKASEYFRETDIEDLISIVEDRAKIHSRTEIGISYKEPHSRKTLSFLIMRLLDEQMNCSVVKEKDKIYKSINKSMIDEFRSKSLS